MSERLIPGVGKRKKMSILLSNKLLTLEIQEPGEIYKGSRFDWTGQITQITYKGKHTFCTTESQNPLEYDELGRGLYNEFGIDMPVGFTSRQIDDKFPKIGIGHLKKDSDSPYDFFRSYEVSPAQFYFIKNKQSVSFFCKTETINGYSFRFKKEITLQENSFIIDYELFNTGFEEIHTNEYVHNFMAVNERNIDNNYILRFPFPVKQDGEIVNPEGKVKFNGQTIKWESLIEKEFFFSEIIPVNSDGVFWCLENMKDHVGIKESCDFKPLRVNLWGGKHVVSPEIFFELKVFSGNSISWKRNYEVYDL